MGGVDYLLQDGLEDRIHKYIAYDDENIQIESIWCINRIRHKIEVTTDILQYMAQFLSTNCSDPLKIIILRTFETFLYRGVVNQF